MLAKTGHNNTGNKMKTLTANDAKFGFGWLIDLARAEPVAVRGSFGGQEVRDLQFALEELR